MTGNFELAGIGIGSRGGEEEPSVCVSSHLTDSNRDESLPFSQQCEIDRKVPCLEVALQQVDPDPQKISADSATG